MVDYDSNVPSETPLAVVRTAQIVAGALITGVIVFLVVAGVIRRTGKDGLFAADPWDVMPPKGVISLVALVTASLMIVMSFMVPKAQAAAVRRALAANTPPPARGAGPDPSFQQGYMVGMIVGMAMLEGVAFLNGIAFLIEGHAPNLIAAGVLIALIVARFPTANRIEAFVQDQSALLIEERQSA